MFEGFKFLYIFDAIAFLDQWEKENMYVDTELYHPTIVKMMFETKAKDDGGFC